MGNVIKKAVNALMMILPALAAIAVVISANNIASPFHGQPVPPKSLKKYRKF